MSSTAMHREPELTYQQRSGRALEQRTKAMIVAAAEQVMAQRIAQAGAAADALAHLSTADICAEARGYLRRDGSEGPIPKATLWKHFKTIEALAGAVVDTMSAGHRPVPDQIVTLAARRESSADRAVAVDTRRMEARLTSTHFDLEQLEQQFARAVADDDRPDMLFWAAELAERHLRRRRRGEPEPVVLARDWARRGLELVDRSTRLDCMLGIRCARAAAAAETILARKPDYEATGLSRIRSIKETELHLAHALGWRLHSLLAEFHIDHARALTEEDPRRELRSLYDVATGLPTLCTTAPREDGDPQDRLHADELAEIIAGLCGLEMAYADHPEHGRDFAALFAEGVTPVVRALLACFPATAGERRRHEGNARALLRLDEFTRHSDEPGAVESYRHAAVDMLRTAEFGTVRDILVARYLTAKAGALGRGSSGDSLVASIIHPKPAGLIQAAIQFYDHAACVSSRRGAVGVLRAQAARAGAELRDHTDAAPLGDNEFDSIARAINDLVLITISRRDRFTDAEVQQLLEMIDPMYYYITAGRN